jgi:L-threonylcarbamoyladenylate synthase
LKEASKYPRIMEVDVLDASSTGIRVAREILLSGGLVAFPTESFYGLAVNAMNEEAIRRLFRVKRRSMDRPVLILVHNEHALFRYVEHIPDLARNLIQRFWPGGLTLVFQAGAAISPLLTGGTGKIGIRLSSHPVATALARSIDGPITGTSANISGRPACRNPEEVYQCLGNEIELILDGGATNGGKSSTIVDITLDRPEILREGIISRDQLKEFL